MTERQRQPGGYRKKLKGLCAWLSAFVIALAAVGAVAPLEVLAAEHYGVMGFTSTEWRDLPDKLYPGDIVGIWSGSGVDEELLNSPAKLQYLDAKGNNIEEAEWPTKERYTNVFAIEIIDYPSSREIPEGQQFICWHVKDWYKVENYNDGIYMNANERVTYASIVLTPVFEPIAGEEEPAEEPVNQAPASQEPAVQNESPEQVFLRQWAAFIVDPDNYLSSITLQDGTQERSAVPTVIQSNTDVGFVVSGTVEEAERAFGKTSAQNQIVVTLGNAYPGEAMQSSLEALAAAGGASLEEVFEIRAVERGKTDYALVREIGETAEAVTYKFSLDPSLRDALASGRSLMVIQYVPSQGSFLPVDDIQLEEGILTIRTQYPSGTFALFLR